MLRLEKFIEATVSLPSELRDELIKMRELDLMVRDATDKQETQIFMFFQNASTLNSENREVVFQSLLSAFVSILEVANEKVNIAERLEDTLSERLEQLDREIEIIQERLFGRNLANNSNLKGKLRQVKRLKVNKKQRSISTTTLRLCGESEINNKTLQQEIVYNSPIINIDEGYAMPSVESITIDDLGIYCFCNRQAYGNMVACDNELCPYEWFHYTCVNMTMAPEGKWYCPKCIVCRVNLERI